MQNINEYDNRQLMLMRDQLIRFKRKQIDLNSFIGGLEFLFNSLETVDKGWGEQFLEAITALETINALMIIRASGEAAPEIDNKEKAEIIETSINAINDMIDKKLSNGYS